MSATPNSNPLRYDFQITPRRFSVLPNPCCKTCEGVNERRGDPFTHIIHTTSSDLGHLTRIIINHNSLRFIFRSFCGMRFVMNTATGDASGFLRTI